MFLAHGAHDTHAEQRKPKTKLNLTNKMQNAKCLKCAASLERATGNSSST